MLDQRVRLAARTGRGSTAAGPVAGAGVGVSPGEEWSARTLAGRYARAINLVWGVLVIVAAVAAAVAGILLVRRRAPDGGFFHDGDRAAGIFGVLATGFSVLLGFVVFLSFESYDESRTGAESEALAVAQQFETAQFLPPEVRPRLGGELICYGRYVVGTEWPRLEKGQQRDEVNPWGIAMFRTIQTARPGSATEEAAYGKWLDQTSDRESSRLDRVHGAEGVIPWPLWAALAFAAVVIFVFMLFFADSGEPALIQAVQIGSVTAVLVTLLLLIRFLDHPYQDGPGGLQPTAMSRTLTILEEELAGVGSRAPLPCDEVGAAR